MGQGLEDCFLAQVFSGQDGNGGNVRRVGSWDILLCFKDFDFFHF